MKTSKPTSLADRKQVLFYAGACAVGIMAVVAALLYMRTKEEAPSLPVPDSMQACEVTSECMLVETRCDRCCGYEAIALAHLNAYMEMYRESCRLYDLHAYREHMNRDVHALDDSNTCECFHKDTIPACIHGACQFSAPPEAQSPSTFLVSVTAIVDGLLSTLKRISHH
jgi:xanthine dehydrogenase iron-sulfur cluster and FAD-binding subunit A